MPWSWQMTWTATACWSCCWPPWAATCSLLGRMRTHILSRCGAPRWQALHHLLTAGCNCTDASMWWRLAALQMHARNRRQVHTTLSCRAHSARTTAWGARLAAGARASHCSCHTQVHGQTGFTARSNWLGIYATEASRAPRDVRGRSLSVQFRVQDPRPPSPTRKYEVAIRLEVLPC